MHSSTEEIQQILEQHFSRQLDQTFLYMRLGVFAIGVLFTGLVLWRVTVIFIQRKNKQRRRTSRFEQKWR